MKTKEIKKLVPALPRPPKGIKSKTGVKAGEGGITGGDDWEAPGV